MAEFWQNLLIAFSLMCNFLDDMPVIIGPELHMFLEPHSCLQALGSKWCWWFVARGGAMLILLQEVPG